MASSINASTSGSGGVITTADNSGILNLQSAGNTIATIQPSGFSLPTGATINAANTFGFENRIINGNMTIDQRNAGASVTPTATTYTLDRWQAVLTQVSKFSVQQNAGAVTPPVGFSNYLGVTSLTAYSVLSTDAFLVAQYIEGFNTSDLQFGTANAQTVTLSFWVRSSLTGTFGGVLNNSAFDRSYLFSYSIPTANTWTKISVTIAGDTSGTWVGATNGLGVAVRFGLGSGSTYTGTANTWQAGNLVQPTGSVSVVGTNGATFYLTGVQFEVGSQATSFDFRSITQETALCQRYYISSGGMGYGMYISSTTDTYRRFTSGFPSAMRTAPTMTGVTSFGASSFDGSNTLNFGANINTGSQTNFYTYTSYTASAEL
jgi:hypothetical protein